MPAHDAVERALIARAANHARQSRLGPAERTAMTADARARFLDRFEKQVDPEGTLDPQDRATRAEHARKSYFALLALKSAKARRARREADRLDAEVAAALADEVA